MKFKKPGAVPDSQTGVRHSAPRGRPDWLKEWIANQGRYVLLECGHKDDLNDRGAILVSVTRERHIWCYSCEDVRKVIRGIRLWEYMNYPPPPELTDTPPF